MINNTFTNRSKLVKIMHTILFIITGLYLLETILFTGLFTNIILAGLNLIVSVICIIISIIKKEYKLTIIDLVLAAITLAIFIYFYLYL